MKMHWKVRRTIDRAKNNLIRSGFHEAFVLHGTLIKFRSDINTDWRELSMTPTRRSR